MDVVVLVNGLGNQMSQYSFFLQKRAKKKSTHLISFGHHHNGIEIGRIFNVNIKEDIFQRFLYLIFRILLTDKTILKPLAWLLRMMDCKIIHEGYDYSFKPKYLTPANGVTFYYGGWHNELYFSGISDDIKSAFSFKKPDDTKNIEHINKIRNTNSVSIHVRRGDYLNAANISLFGDVCNKSYFDKAVKLIEAEVADPHFFIFSNDFAWVKDNLLLNNVTYVTENTGNNSWKDMYLMSLCKNNIISNSTFSWWGAWLNDNPDKIVVAPHTFLKGDLLSDIYPEQWLKLSDY